MKARRLKLSLRLRLFILAAVALAPALAILAYNEVTLRRSREAEVHQLAVRFGQLAAQELEGIVGGTESLLRAVARSPVVRTFGGEACGAYLADVQMQSPSIATLTVIDMEGRVRCRPDMLSPGQSLADRPYFKDAVATGHFVVGEYTVSRLSPYAGLPMAAPIRNEAGDVIGVLAAGLDLRWLEERLKGRDFTRGGALTIADRNGVIIAREPYPEQFIGTRIPEAFLPLVRATAPGSREVLIKTVPGGSSATCRRPRTRLGCTSARGCPRTRPSQPSTERRAVAHPWQPWAPLSRSCRHGLSAAVS